jgi:hypothetical protein
MHRNNKIAFRGFIGENNQSLDKLFIVMPKTIKKKLLSLINTYNNKSDGLPNIIIKEVKKTGQLIRLLLYKEGEQAKSNEYTIFKKPSSFKLNDIAKKILKTE